MLYFLNLWYIMETYGGLFSPKNLFTYISLFPHYKILCFQLKTRKP